MLCCLSNTHVDRTCWASKRVDVCLATRSVIYYSVAFHAINAVIGFGRCCWDNNYEVHIRRTRTLLVLLASHSTFIEWFLFFNKVICIITESLLQYTFDIFLLRSNSGFWLVNLCKKENSLTFIHAYVLMRTSWCFILKCDLIWFGVSRVTWIMSAFTRVR